MPRNVEVELKANRAKFDRKEISLEEYAQRRDGLLDYALSPQYLEATYIYNDPKPESLPEPVPTLRDQFAMAALTGLMALPSSIQTNVAEVSYLVADCMLAARETKS